MRAHRLGVTALAAFLLLAAACSDSGTTTTTGPAPATTAPSTTVPPAPTTTPAQVTTTRPAAASPVRSQLGWVIDALSGAEPTVADVEERFDDLFLSQVPAVDLIAALEAVAAQIGGVATLDTVLYETEFDGVFVLTSPEATEGLQVSIAVAQEPPHRIIGLLLVPAGATELEDPPQTWEELSIQLGDLAAGVGVLAAEVADGACVPIHETNADTSFALGSAFKLYVLGALAEAIASGEAGWDDPLAIRDDLKSLPSGTMQAEPAGTEFTLFEYAKLMISISDNTATDHLIDLLGRSAVEAAQAPLGHADPAANVPFLTTRELFLLKLALPADDVDAYLSLGSEERTTFLDERVAALSLDDVELSGLAAPNRIDTLEWFASPADLCRALVLLGERAAAPGLEPIRDVLDTPAAQLGVDGTPWEYFAFKGGSEPGVLAVAILGERTDGRTFVGVLLLNDTEQAFSELRAVLYANEAMRLLAGHP